MLDTNSKLSIQKFKAHLLRLGHKQTTIYRHINIITRLLNEVGSLNAVSLELYLSTKLQEGLKASSINKILVSARIWGDFIGIPELRTVKKFKEKIPIRAALTDEEIDRFLSVESPTSIGKKTWDEMTLFFTILSVTGMRSVELCSLTWNHIDWGNGVFVLEDTKTNENRRVWMPPKIAEALAIRAREMPTAGFLFDYHIKTKGSEFQLAHSIISRHFWKRIQLAQIPPRKGLSTRSLRRSYITTMLQQPGVNLFDVKNLVGHKRTETTEKYYELATNRLVEAASQHPRLQKEGDKKKKLKALADFAHSRGLTKDEGLGFIISDSEVRIWIK